MTYPFEPPYPLCTCCGDLLDDGQYLVHEGACYCNERCLAAKQALIEKYIEAAKVNRHIFEQCPPQWKSWDDACRPYDPWHRDDYHYNGGGKP
jgi:hypothetical protein